MQTITEQGAAITVTTGEMDGIRHPDPALARLVYLELRIHQGEFDYDTVTGWVRPNAAALLKAAPELLALARQYASECAECGGTGNSGNFDVGDEHCGDCADIRAVIAKATGSYEHIAEKPQTYSLAEIRNGTGWPRDARFMLAGAA